MRKIIFGFIASAFLVACSTEVDVNAPYVETPIIYSLINSDDSLQTFRIQRAFTGANGNAIELSKERDQIYYDTADIDLNLRLITSSGQQIYNQKLNVFLCDNCKEPDRFRLLPLHRLHYW